MSLLNCICAPKLWLLCITVNKCSDKAGAVIDSVAHAKIMHNPMTEAQSVKGLRVQLLRNSSCIDARPTEVEKPKPYRMIVTLSIAL